MTGRIPRFCALALALCCAAPALAARVVDPAGARAALATPAVAARDAGLAALAAEGRAGELASRLELIAHDASLPDVAREWLIDRGLHALAGMEPSPAARAAVTQLAARRPSVFTRVDPDHGERVTPLYDAGATARFVLSRWERDAAFRAASAGLAARDARVTARYAAEPSPAARAGIADAFRAAPDAGLAAQRGAVEAALLAGRRVDELARIVALRLGDRGLLGHVLDYADEPEALAAIAAAGALDAHSALGLLERASRRADIASAAVLEAGRIAARDPAARRFLFEALADLGTAPSAAAALGRLGDAEVAAEIGRRLQEARSDGERRPLVLALRLDGSAAARAELERFARGGAGSPGLRAKALRGLER